MSSNANFEQALAALRDSLPRIWWALYQGCLSAGFQPYQAMTMVQTYILSQNPNGSIPPKIDPHSEEQP